MTGLWWTARRAPAKPDAMSLPDKREVAEALLERGSVFLHLDPRHEGVSIPAWLRKQPQVVLQVGLGMAIPIPDLEVDDEGVRATLSFNRSPYWCVIPWDAVFALVGDDGRGRVFLDSMPAEIRREVDREATATQVGSADDDFVDDESGEADLESDLDEAESRAFGSIRDDRDERSDGEAGPSADVIPLWPRSVTGRGARPGASRPSPGRGPSKASSKEPPEDPRPRPPHPHLRRVK